MREGFPNAFGLSQTGRDRVFRAKNAGDNYLNVEFGWKPLVRDLRKFADSYFKSEKILSEYHKNSGKLLRRSYRWPVEIETSITENNAAQALPIMATANYGTSITGKRTLTTTWKTERWLVASFMYHVPDPGVDPFGAKRSDINQLYGTNLTPNAVWNMTPWTWAADWVGNGGSIAANLSYLGTDGLIMPHCYIMEKKSIKRVYEFRGPTGMYRTYPAIAPYFTQTFETVCKYRKKGTPYGFGLNWDGFTPKQLGILAALGVSKGV
jgi:hypothetical protein